MEVVGPLRYALKTAINSVVRNIIANMCLDVSNESKDPRDVGLFLRRGVAAVASQAGSHGTSVTVSVSVT